MTEPVCLCGCRSDIVCRNTSFHAAECHPVWVGFDLERMLLYINFRGGAIFQTFLFVRGAFFFPAVFPSPNVLPV